jgi:hypothetical protein
MSDGLSVIVRLNGRDRVDRFIAPLQRSLAQLDAPCGLVVGRAARRAALPGDPGVDREVPSWNTPRTAARQRRATPGH